MAAEIQLPLSDDDEPTYIKPAIVHELDLETRAGSPLRIDPLLDPLGLDPTVH